VTAFQQEFTPAFYRLFGHWVILLVLPAFITSQAGVLFSGRLAPDQLGEPVLRTAKTFHWPRQIKSFQSLLDRFTPETLQYICPAANTGFLRGKRVVIRYQRLTSLDLSRSHR